MSNFCENCGGVGGHHTTACLEARVEVAGALGFVDRRVPIVKGDRRDIFDRRRARSDVVAMMRMVSALKAMEQVAVDMATRPAYNKDRAYFNSLLNGLTQSSVYAQRIISEGRVK